MSSGASVTWCHHSIVLGSKYQAIISLIITIALATVFTALQGFEYVTAPFTISDSVYGSSFYMATGFHGFHVTLGTIMLIVVWLRGIRGHFKPEAHFGFEGVAWYWHFVDVVWLGLFIFVYWL